MTRQAGDTLRIDATLAASATVEGRRHGRTGPQQLEHWARIGRSLSFVSGASRERLDQALAGTRPLSDLTEAESLVFHAEIDARIAARLTADNYSAALARQGITTIGLDNDGHLVSRDPDGTTRTLDDD